MTFEEWQGTRERDDDGSDYGFDGPVYVYAAGNIMIHPATADEPERYEVLIENWFDEITPDLAAAEKMLWDNWAKDEIGAAA